MFALGAGRWLLAVWTLGAALAFVAVLAFDGSGASFGPASAWAAAAAAVAALAGFLSVFFRDPDRAVGSGIVSAADGRVREVKRDAESWRVSVFMNVTNVHVNRSPYPGTVVHVDDRGRGNSVAYSPAAESNVQRRYLLDTTLGPLEVVQITGAVARRLVSWVQPGIRLEKGERFGMIAFGSRVDVRFPASAAEPCVAVGDRVRAGSTTIAREHA